MPRYITIDIDPVRRMHARDYVTLRKHDLTPKGHETVGRCSSALIDHMCLLILRPGRNFHALDGDGQGRASDGPVVQITGRHHQTLDSPTFPSVSSDKRASESLDQRPISQLWEVDDEDLREERMDQRRGERSEAYVICAEDFPHLCGHPF